MEHILPTDGSINLLGFSAEMAPDEVENLAAAITEAERQRAQRFHFPLDRAMFISARSVLRRVCSLPLGCHPHEVPIVINAFGKPGLRVENCPIEFSISHSAGSVLLAFSCGRKLGVDLEQISDAISNVDSIFFTDDEMAILQAVPPRHRTEMFCKGWVMKEAFLKAVGEGLSYSPGSVSLASGLLKEAGTFYPLANLRDGSRWLVQDLGIYQETFMAAIACEEQGPAPTVSLVQLNPLTLERMAEKLPAAT